MTTRSHLSRFLLLLPLGLAAACSSTSTTAAPQPPQRMTEEEAMARMMELGTPGPEHKALMAQAGDWDIHYRFRMAPDAPWMETQGTSHAEPILGGRFLMEKQAFDMMGQPVEGLLLLGFDNEAKEYISLWTDSWSTWWVEARGTAGANGVTEMRGTMKDVAGTRPYRMTVTHTADGGSEHEMFDTIDGKEVLVMTYRMTRKN